MTDSRPTISTQVLDIELGMPAAGVPVALFRVEEDGQPELLNESETDGDGRVRSLLRGDLEVGAYQLVFDLAAYAASQDRDADFFEHVALGIRVDEVDRSYHLPVLLSPFGITTYRS